MGSTLSCCCGRRSKNSPEKEPLLPRNATSAATPSRDHIQQLAAAFGALSAGKLPSQAQINGLVQAALKSNALNTNEPTGSGYGPLSARGRQVLDDVRELGDAILQFGLEKNHDDAIQEFWFQCQAVQEPVRVQVDVKLAPQIQTEAAAAELSHAAIPTEDEVKNDTLLAALAIRDLASLLFTSTTLRLILSDTLLTLRQSLADVAVDVANVASLVQTKAADVEDVVRPPPGTGGVEGLDEFDAEVVKGKSKQVVDQVGDIVDETAREAKRRQARSWTTLEQNPNRVKEIVLERIKNLILQAQETPAYRSAATTLFLLFRKYTERAAALAASAHQAAESTVIDSYTSTSTSSHVTPIISTDQHLDIALALLRTIVERLASGHSIDPIISKFEKLINRVDIDRGNLKVYLQECSDWLTRALGEQSEWIHSSEAAVQAEQLYDRSREIFSSNPEFQSEARALIDAVEDFIDALKTDRATARVVRGAKRLEEHVRLFGNVGVGVLLGRKEALKEASRELWDDALGWFLPRVLKALKTLPIPRVEFVSEALDLVVDNVVLASPSFVPDHITISSSNTLHLSASDALPGPSSSHSTLATQRSVDSTTHVHISGLRISAESISYFLHLKPPPSSHPWLSAVGLGYKDNGLLSVDVGSKGQADQGVDLDLVLETRTDDSFNNSMYAVRDVKVDVPGLGFKFDRTRHWVLNRLFVQPLLGPTVRTVVGSVVSSQVRALLEALDTRLFEVHERAKDVHQRRNEVLRTGEEGSLPTLSEYWSAYMQIQREKAEEAERELARERADPSIPNVESEVLTRATVKGVVRTTHTTVDVPDSTEEPQESETVLAVGVGEQILPGLGGPEGEQNEGLVETVVDEARHAMDDVQDAAEQLEGEVVETRKELEITRAEVRQSLDEGARVLEDRKQIEEKRKGWRSAAFDLDW